MKSIVKYGLLLMATNHVLFSCTFFGLATAEGGSPEASLEAKVFDDSLWRDATQKECAESSCPHGRCLFVDCANSPSCVGGLCKFVRCHSPTCDGGLCLFEECHSPLCRGGACVFRESKSSLGHGYCEGGACTIDGRAVASNMKDHLAE